MAITPVITFPTSLPGFSTNLENQTLSGTADPSTVSILVNGATGGVTYTSGATTWVFTVMLANGDNVFNVVAKDSNGFFSTPDTLTITQTNTSNLNLIVSAPTGLTLERGRNFVKISVIQNPETEVIGYNFYGSEDAGGGLEGFTLLNPTIVTSANPDYYVENTVVLSETVNTTGNIRTTYTVERIEATYYYAYEHNRLDQPLGNNPISEPNHYVVTAVAFDPTLLQQVESPYSGELGAAPLVLTTNITDLPSRTTSDVQQSYITEILQTDNTIDVKPGTITRDIHIDPPSDEFARLYVIQDFMHRSQSFLTLLDIDDPDNTGTSVTVTSSTYKVALQTALLIPVGQEAQVQQLIDDAFTKLAGNVNVTRKAAQQAIGQALFYTRATPTRDSSINAGSIIETVSDAQTSTVRFSVLTDFTMPVADLANYYNFNTERYEITLDIQAIDAGSAGNVNAGTITLIVSGIDSVFGVTNPNPTEFGQDLESNTDLAQRAILAFVSVDAGTEGGYLATTLGTSNVEQAKIVSAGDILMQRDIDSLRLIHTYGKVDIYIQGNLETTYQDTFGFIYDVVRNEPAIIQSITFFQFKSTNVNITITNSIYLVIQVLNVTRSASYDTTGVIISGDGNVIQLDNTNVTNIAIGLAATDVIFISYRYRAAPNYIFINQPVDAIVSVVGAQSGALTSANYVLQKLQDPLSYGNSTSSQDDMQIIYANGVPLGLMTTIENEVHTLVGDNTVTLGYYAIDETTIVVMDSTLTITYIKDIDYTVISGSTNVLVQIARLVNSSIPDGAIVFVTYDAGENFVVTYNVNSLLQNVQTRINTMKHLTADVVVKGVRVTYIDFNMTVILTAGSDQITLDRQIRTAIAKMIAAKLIGEPIYQSDVIKAIEEVTGVDHTVVPFAKMVRADNSMVIRELLDTSWTVYLTTTVTSYMSVQTLSWATVDQGGPTNAFRGVFENDIPLTLVSTAAQVSESAGQAYISADGHVYISPRLGNITGTSLSSTITVTYIVIGATGARDIDFCDIEYGAVGTLVITYAFGKSYQGF